MTIGVAGVAAAMECLERAWAYRTITHPEGRAVFPDGVRCILTQYFAEIQSLRCFIREAARLRDDGRLTSVAASQIKLLGSDLAVRTAQDAVEFMGEQGYLRETGVERILRDSKALQIVEGTNQIQRWVLAREMEKMQT
jgi:alkylation response protein AidB-like acyl-CoA dehydrogenase